MMILKEITPQQHDAFMTDHPKEHFMQCSLWAEAKRSSGWSAETVGLFDKEQLLASSLLLYRTIPFLKSKICYAPRGYIIDYKNWDLVKEFTEQLKAYCLKKNVCYIMVDPDIHLRVYNANDELIEENLNIVEKMESMGYRHQGYNMSFDMTQPRFTFRLKLDKSKEEIFANYSKIIRASMNNANRIGIVCKKEDNIDVFYDIMKDTADRNHFVERHKDYYETIYRLYKERDMATCYSATYYPQSHLDAMNAKAKELSEEKKKCQKKLETSPQDTRSANRIKQIEIQEEKLHKDQSKVEEFLNRYPNGLALSSGITISTKNRAWLVYGGNRSEMRDANANYAIKQFEINDDIDKGYEFVDFFGTIGNPTKESEHIGIHEFKKKFSGDYIEFPGEFHLVLKPIHYEIWTKALPKAKQIMRKIRKRKTEK